MKKQTILLPLFYRYYIFEYYQSIVEELLSRGHEVHLCYMFEDVLEDYLHLEKKGLKFVKCPRVLRAFQNRAGKPIFRIGLWITGWVWGLSIKGRYDYLLLPWDSKPLWYILGRLLPSITHDVITNFIDLDIRFNADKFNREENFYDKILVLIEKVSKTNIRPSLNGKVVKYNARATLVDWLMGKRAENYYPGFGAADNITVTGEKMKSNYLKAGLDKEIVHVVGNPAYDKIIKHVEGKNFKEKIFEKYEINSDRLVSLFLSPSSFSDLQAEEVQLVINLIHDRFKSTHFVIKFHPKTNKGEHEKVLNPLYEKGIKITEIRDFSGDLENAEIMKASDFIVQKQCTLGFLAMVLKVPMISYNILKTNYEDDMYKHLEASFHCESEEELSHALEKVTNENDLHTLKEMQELACSNFCLNTGNASQQVADIIEKCLEVRSES